MFPDWEVSYPNSAECRDIDSRRRLAISGAVNATRVVLTLCEGGLFDRQASAVIGPNLEVARVLGMLGFLCHGLLATPALHLRTVVEGDRSGVDGLTEAARNAARLPFHKLSCIVSQRGDERDQDGDQLTVFTEGESVASYGKDCGDDNLESEHGDLRSGVEDS